MIAPSLNPAIVMITFMVSIGVLYVAGPVLIPLLLALCLAILLDPGVVALERRGIARKHGTVMIILLFGLGLAGATAMLYDSVTELAVEAPAYRAKISELQAWVAESSRTWDSPVAGPAPAQSSGPDVQKVELVERYPSWFGFLFRGLSSLFGMVGIALFVPLILFFLLLEKSNLMESFNSLSGRYWYLPKLNAEIPQMMRYFFGSHVVIGLGLAATHWGVLEALGLSHARELGWLTGFLNLLPVIGAPVAIAIIWVQALLQWSEPMPFVIVAMAIGLLHFVATNIVLPRLLGPRINVNSVTLLVGLLFWGWLWGAIGFVLAIPLTASLRIFLAANPRSFAWSNLMASRIRAVPAPGVSAIGPRPKPPAAPLPLQERQPLG